MHRYFASIVVAAGILLHTHVVPSAGQVEVGGAVFTEECYANIVTANANNDTRLSQSEYLTFAQLQGPPGIIDDVESFPFLPAEYRAVYTTLACLCSDPVFGGNPSNPTCCVQDQSIRVPGPPGDMQSDQDLRMLFAICALTDSAAREVTNSEAPTIGPTDSPTAQPTITPTIQPTFAPTPRPTEMPVVGTMSPVTSSPTAAPIPPTSFPTALPTNSPTDMPTSQPTFDPTEAPTNAPTTETDSPTVSPTVSPTGVPTVSAAPSPRPSNSPTVEPTISPAPTSTPTTASPTSLPTSSPTLPTIQIQTFVNFSVAFNDGQNATDLAFYYSDLVVAMDRLSDTVAAQIWGQRRRLQDVISVRARKPTRIAEATPIDCDPEFTSANDLCQDIRAEVTLDVRGTAADLETIRLRYQSGLFNEIYDGELQNELDRIEADILVITGLADGNIDRDVDGEGDSLSSGAIGAIVAGSLFGVVLPLCVFLYSRSRSNYESEIKREGLYHQEEVAEVMEEKPSELEPTPSLDSSLYTDAAVQSTPSVSVAAALGAGTLGASQPDYGRASRKAIEAMEAGEDIVAEPEMDHQPDSSSNAGSSGWSSSAGLSSYNTGSLDDSTDAAAAAGATLAAIGVSSNLSRKLESERKKDTSTGSAAGEERVSRDQLDDLIEAGDWAAVGATAALLAAASDSQSQTSRSGAGSRQGSSSAGSIDAARAAELDHLVEAGDWEGVVLAAARFEASDTAGGSRGSRSGQSIDSASATDSATGGATGSSPSVQSESLTASDDPSKVKKRAEVREEVEALVRRVVPEEIDNVDEMMNQFKGREEELVETLRTMQERAVAQKARAAGQRAAKAEARRNVQRGVVPGANAVKTPTEGEEGQPSTPSGQVSSGSSASGSHKGVRTALEEAIDAGDWDAVGRAAAMMSDASTGSTGDVDRFAGAGFSQSSAGTGGSGSRSSLGGLNAARAAELDAMIDRGDWTGVVAAANRFSQADKKPARSGRTKEEEEALAQAEKWAKIAQQKKPGATDAAASDAAEWAIQRSLSQMKQADKDKASAPANEDEDEV